MSAGSRGRPCPDRPGDALAARIPGLIPGIHNYCDRWCERCSLTSRCAIAGPRSRDRAAGPAEDEGNNEEFWNQLAFSFAAAIRKIRKEAGKRGIDLDSPQLQAATERADQKRRRSATRSGASLSKAASSYRKAGHKLLRAIPGALADTEEALATENRLGIGQPDTTAAAIRDALDGVHWYLFFIEVKLRRAVQGAVDERQVHLADLPSDSDSSAKIALLAIDRSIAAWARLREHFAAEHGDAILNLLVQLERLRRAAEAKFPHAREFKRPGFD
ncbi:MAG: hypothetical protein QM691_13085 [Opitutaceae bacterium]